MLEAVFALVIWFADVLASRPSVGHVCNLPGWWASRKLRLAQTCQCHCGGVWFWTGRKWERQLTLS